MAIHIQDEEAGWLVREFARKRDVGLTAAIKLAIREASAKEISAGEELARKIEPIVSQIRALKRPTRSPTEHHALCILRK